MHTWNRRLHVRAGGFTLIELMVVMVILVLLAGGASLYVIRRIEDGRRTTAFTDLRTIENALEQYYVHNGHYPSSDEGLAALVAAPASAGNWQGPYLKRAEDLLDPWGNSYQYREPGEYDPDFDLWSYGRDGVEGGEGPDADVTSWDEPPV